MEYTTVDRILSRLNRDLKGTDIHETDVIEWIGEALEYIKVPDIKEQLVTFLEVKDYHVNLPSGLQSILQIVKNNDYNKKYTKADFVSPEEEVALNPVPISPEGNPLEEYEYAYFRPVFDLQWEYDPFYRNHIIMNNFTPVRLANSSFFNSIVCKEKRDIPYQDCRDEYTIVGTTNRRIRFSFKEGQIAIAYVRTAIDPISGYPLIPDEISTITAITYYIRWKMAERLSWDGREGFAQKVVDEERKWLKYIRQAINYHKKPKTIDDFQDLLEQTHYLVPSLKQYYNNFSKLNSPENRDYLK